MRKALTRFYLALGAAAGLGPVLGLVLGLVLGVSTNACDTGSVADPLVVTSVIVRADQLTRGMGCGERPNQVYKYVVLVKGGSKQIFTGGVYDCFADAAFESLRDPRFVDGVAFTFNIYLFDKATYEASRRLIDSAPALTEPNLLEAFPFGQAECTAIQRESVQTVASCSTPTPLGARMPGDASAPDSAAADAESRDSSLPDSASTGDSSSADAASLDATGD